MCVKEFLGYNCGHCSTPVLRACPLTLSNDAFPPCAFPAERPIFTNEYCQACSRVVWNQKVLAEEEKHREKHLHGDICCDVIFEGEDREKRLKMMKSKHRTTGPTPAREPGGEVRYAFATQKPSGDGEAGPSEGSEARYARVEQYGSNIKNQGSQATPSIEMSTCPRRGWEPKATQAAYQYLGYYVRDSPQQRPVQSHPQPGADPSNYGYGAVIPTPVQGYGAAFNNGFVPHNMLWEGQMYGGQMGAGMKWYPQQDVLQRDVLPPLPPPLQLVENYRHTAKAKSEPAKSTYQTSEAEVGEHEDESNPVVVSSDVAQNESA
ncbi:hypothetical protein G7Y89_g14077 [Cudoniella acicularis]|uniref:Uncharacterized protein n=1 Tax=Cudoniella acicularis TaxID=354080 RepID=A0A8H4R9F3_9HELO|nr:hypothetical protein G7Y89_g14077 [Cudoniella acicularis]